MVNSKLCLDISKDWHDSHISIKSFLHDMHLTKWHFLVIPVPTLTASNLSAVEL